MKTFSQLRNGRVFVFDGKLFKKIKPFEYNGEVCNARSLERDADYWNFVGDESVTKIS